MMPDLGALSTLDLVVDDGLAEYPIPQLSVRRTDDDGCWLFRPSSTHQVSIRITAHMSIRMSIRILALRHSMLR